MGKCVYFFAFVDPMWPDALTCISIINRIWGCWNDGL